MFGEGNFSFYSIVAISLPSIAPSMHTPTFNTMFSNIKQYCLSYSILTVSVVNVDMVDNPPMIPTMMNVRAPSLKQPSNFIKIKVAMKHANRLTINVDQGNADEYTIFDVVNLIMPPIAAPSPANNSNINVSECITGILSCHSSR